MRPIARSRAGDAPGTDGHGAQRRLRQHPHPWHAARRAAESRSPATTAPRVSASRQLTALAVARPPSPPEPSQTAVAGALDAGLVPVAARRPRTTSTGRSQVDTFVTGLTDVLPISPAPGAEPWRFDTGDPDPSTWPLMGVMGGRRARRRRMDRCSWTAAEWYLVTPAQLVIDAPTGWARREAEDGTSLLGPSDLRCPGNPTTAEDLAPLQLTDGLAACYGAEDVVITGDLACDPPPDGLRRRGELARSRDVQPRRRARRRSTGWTPTRRRAGTRSPATSTIPRRPRAPDPDDPRRPVWAAARLQGGAHVPPGLRGDRDRGALGRL